MSHSKSCGQLKNPKIKPSGTFVLCARKRGLTKVAFKLFKFVLHQRVLFIIYALNQAEKFVIVMFRLAVHTTVVVLKTYTAPDC